MNGIFKTDVRAHIVSTDFIIVPISAKDILTVHLRSLFQLGFAMDAAERQAVHALRDDLYEHVGITDRILRHLLTQGKINKTEKYELSVSLIVLLLHVLNIISLVKSWYCRSCDFI